MLGKLKNLTTLLVGDTQITDLGAKELRELNRLQHLDLGCPQITDAAMREVGILKHLTELFSFQAHRSRIQGLKDLNELAVI